MHVYVVMYVAELVAMHVCALSVQCQVRRPYHALHPPLHEGCKI